MTNEAEHLIDIYLDGVIAAAEQAGCFGNSVLAAAIDYLNPVKTGARSGNEIPITHSTRTGRVGDQDMAMINAAMKVRRPPRKFLESSAYLKRIKPEQMIAVCCHRFYLRRTDQEGNKMTQDRIAEYCGLTLDQYKVSKRNGYQQMRWMISLVNDVSTAYEA